jgi:hypothetical protein
MRHTELIRCVNPRSVCVHSRVSIHVANARGCSSAPIAAYAFFMTKRAAPISDAVINAGDTIRSHQILAPLGSGGMGKPKIALPIVCQRARGPLNSLAGSSSTPRNRPSTPSTAMPTIRNGMSKSQMSG